MREVRGNGRCFGPRTFHVALTPIQELPRGQLNAGMIRDPMYLLSVRACGQGLFGMVPRVAALPTSKGVAMVQKVMMDKLSIYSFG